MDPTPSFDQVLADLRAGKPEAWDALVRHHAGPLARVARDHLSGRLRQKADPEDIVQSVFRSFFRHLNAGQFEVAGWDSLWGLLLRITVHKCSDLANRYAADKRDLDREQPLPAGPTDGSPARALEILGVRDPGPSPDQAAQLVETVEHLLRGFDPADQRILELLLQDHTHAEISEQVGCSERTVSRVVRRARAVLQVHLDCSHGTTS